MGRRLVASFAVAALFLGGCATTRHFRAGQASFERGRVLFDQGRFEAAIPYFREAIAENPEFGQAYLYLGRSYVSTRRWRDAIQPLRAAHRLAPDETQEEVFNLLLDAFLAVSGAGESSDSARSQNRPPEPP
jgi:tetratricopeptide (TPR) repeat protein